MNEIQKRLEYLRAELRAERISYSELAELADLAEYIEVGDVELEEPAGIPECNDCNHGVTDYGITEDGHCPYCERIKTKEQSNV